MKFTKQQIEKSIAEKFISLYNRNFITDYTIKKNGEQGRINEPDIICNNNLNIEIVSNHYSNDNVAHIEKQIKLEGMAQSLDIEGPDNIAFNFLMEQIRKKESKVKECVYSYEGKIFLVVYLNTPITTMNNYKSFFEKNRIENSQFDEIWLFDKRTLIMRPYMNDYEYEFVEGGIACDEYVIYKIY